MGSDPVYRLIRDIAEGILYGLQDRDQGIPFDPREFLKNFPQLVHYIHNSCKYIEYVCYSENNTIIYYLYPSPQ